MSKKDSLNIATPNTGRSIGQNLKVTGQMVKTAIAAGVSKIKGQK